MFMSMLREAHRIALEPGLCRCLIEDQGWRCKINLASPKGCELWVSLAPGVSAPEWPPISTVLVPEYDRVAYFWLPQPTYNPVVRERTPLFVLWVRRGHAVALEVLGAVGLAKLAAEGQYVLVSLQMAHNSILVA